LRFSAANDIVNNRKGSENVMDRFEIGKDTQGKKLHIDGTRIIVDKETGVQYLFAWSGYAGGLTLLVDKEGKPLLEKNTAE
jgi:hypothetical protein